jgi:hypothetical protein
MRISDLEKAVGGLSTPSKMPGFSYGIPAQDCILGSILRKKEGSVCGKCYAFKGMYVFPCVKNAQKRRLEILRADLPTWTNNMVELLQAKYRNKKSKKDRVFRFHDSGDIQSLEHLEAIVQIAKNLPSIRFWLPTKEIKTIRLWLSANPKGFPLNLIVRISAPMIGRPAAPISGTLSSTVSAGVGYSCPAPKQGNNCGDCRACWSLNVPSVDYHEH